MTGSSSHDSLEGLEERRKQLEQLSRPLQHLVLRGRISQRGLLEVAVSKRRDAYRWVHISRRRGGTMIGRLDWRESIEELFGGVQLWFSDNVLRTDPDCPFASYYPEGQECEFGRHRREWSCPTEYVSEMSISEYENDIVDILLH
jgi:hypothetical protein